MIRIQRERIYTVSTDKQGTGNRPPTISYHPVGLQYLHISYPKRYTNTHARSYSTAYQSATSPSEILYRRKEAEVEFGNLPYRAAVHPRTKCSDNPSYFPHLPKTYYPP